MQPSLNLSEFVAKNLNKAIHVRTIFGMLSHSQPCQFLEINLGPTYLSEKLTREVYELRKKEYLFKEDRSGQVKGRVKK